MTGELVSYREAAAILGRSISTVRRMVHRGLFAVCPAPDNPMILRRSINDYIATHTTPAVKPINGKRRAPQ